MEEKDTREKGRRRRRKHSMLTEKDQLKPRGGQKGRCTHACLSPHYVQLYDGGVLRGRALLGVEVRTRSVQLVSHTLVSALNNVHWDHVGRQARSFPIASTFVAD